MVPSCVKHAVNVNGAHIRDAPLGSPGGALGIVRNVCHIGFSPSSGGAVVVHKRFGAPTRTNCLWCQFVHAFLGENVTAQNSPGFFARNAVPIFPRKLLCFVYTCKVHAGTKHAPLRTGKQACFTSYSRDCSGRAVVHHQWRFVGSKSKLQGQTGHGSHAPRMNWDPKRRRRSNVSMTHQFRLRTPVHGWRAWQSTGKPWALRNRHGQQIHPERRVVNDQLCLEKFFQIPGVSWGREHPTMPHVIQHSLQGVETRSLWESIRFAVSGGFHEKLVPLLVFPQSKPHENKSGPFAWCNGTPNFFRDAGTFSQSSCVALFRREQFCGNGRRRMNRRRGITRRRAQRRHGTILFNWRKYREEVTR